MPLRRRFVYSRTIDTVIVRIETDTGHVGWGECKAPVAPQATAKIVELLLTDILIGADPRDVLVLWERMYAGMRVRGHRAGFYVEAIAGVDIALWDLAGQAAGVPISTLLGGKMRESVRVYASGIPSLPARRAGRSARRAGRGSALAARRRLYRREDGDRSRRAGRPARDPRDPRRTRRRLRDLRGRGGCLFARRRDAARRGDGGARRRLLRDADPAGGCRGLCRAGAASRRSRSRSTRS